MKRFRILVLIAALVFAGGLFPARGVSEEADEHPIKLEITCDPAPELEGAGTIPDLLFTIRNTSDADYSLTNGKLTGGYENREMILTESILVLAGGTKEFHLENVPVADDQLGVEITYMLSWDEAETVIDPETGDATFLTHKRVATASMTVERFVVPELTVYAVCADELVRLGETFTVEYHIENRTDFDMSGLKLYDPEQSMQSIALPKDELVAGDSCTVSVEYQMGKNDMTFAPRVEYVARLREMVTRMETPLSVGSFVVDLRISTEAYPATAEGTTFAVTVRNAGNRTVTDIRVFDEINTPIENAFDLAPDQSKSILYTVAPAVSSETGRTVRFHLTAVDFQNDPIALEDVNAFHVVPYVGSDDVRIGLYVVLQSPYYDETGKLCASIQFEIRNYGDVKIYRAVLNELTLFGEVVSYDELLKGETYYTQTYQLDGVQELRFRLDAVDPAGQPCSSETIRLDLSGLKELADLKNDPVYVYTQNPYMQDLDAKYSGVLKTGALIGVTVAGVCAVICIVLFIIELQIKAKLPPEFEEDMERAMRATKRRMDKQLFSDAPTEQFGYTAPIKLRDYGELTEEEAKARRALYEKGMRERFGTESEPSQRTDRTPVRLDADGVRVVPPKTTQQAHRTDDGTRVIPTQKPQATRTDDGTRIIPTQKPQATRTDDGTRAVSVRKPTPVKPTDERKTEPVQKPQPAQRATSDTLTVPVQKPKTEPRPEPEIPIIPIDNEPIYDTKVLPPYHPNPIVPPVMPTVPRMDNTLGTTPPPHVHSAPPLAQGRQAVESDEPALVEPERNPANTIVGDVVLDVPPKPDNPPDTLRVPPSLAQGRQEVEPEPEPVPVEQNGPRVLREKEQPARRPIVRNPIIRMNG